MYSVCRVCNGCNVECVVCGVYRVECVECVMCVEFRVYQKSTHYTVTWDESAVLSQRYQSKSTTVITVKMSREYGINLRTLLPLPQSYSIFRFHTCL